MSTVLVILVSGLVFALLALFGFETIREFRKMNRHPEDYTGSDRLAGTGE